MLPISDLQHYSNLQATKISETSKLECRSVAFDTPANKIYIVPSLTSYTTEEIKSCWYSPDDLALIQIDTRSTLILMEQNLPIDETCQCLRGLERSTRTAIETKEQDRTHLLQAVAREYYMQKQYGHDPSVLADMYSRQCAHDRESAHLIATVDEEESLRIFLHDMADVFFNAPEDDYEDDEDEIDSREDIHYAMCWSESLLRFHRSLPDNLEAVTNFREKQLGDEVRGELRALSYHCPTTEGTGRQATAA